MNTETEKMPRVGVSFFCHNHPCDERHRNLFLMNFRSENCRDEKNTWDVGSGGVHFGETLEESVKREVQEEYLTKVLMMEYLGFRETFREENGEKIHWIHFDFKVLIDSTSWGNGEPKKFKDVRMFGFDEIPEPLHSLVPNFFERYGDRLFPKGGIGKDFLHMTFSEFFKFHEDRIPNGIKWSALSTKKVFFPSGRLMIYNSRRLGSLTIKELTYGYMKDLLNQVPGFGTETYKLFKKLLDISGVEYNE